MLVYSKNNFTTEKKSINDRFKLLVTKGYLHRKYQLFDDSLLVHESTIFRITPLAIFAGYISFKVVGNCYTNPRYRGQGIYGMMINYLWNQEGKFILFVNDDNFNSQSGLTKVGFHIIDKFIIKRKVGWIYLVYRS